VTPTALIYREQLLGGSETFIRDQAEALRRYRPLYVGARRVPGLQLPAERTRVLNDGSALGRLREMAFKASGRAPGLERALRREGPALMHVHFGTDAVFAIPLARRLGVPLAVTFHGYDITARPGPGSGAAHRRFDRARPDLNRAATLLIAVSGFIRDRLLEAGFDAERVRVHYIGVDTDYFTARDQPRTRTVLFVGRLVEKKGCALLIEAMAQLGERQVDLVVIGDGPLRGELEAAARAAGIHHRFLGARPREEVREWMQRARVFCVPSVVAASGDAEGFGLVFAEAQSMGLPVASFATGGIPEAVAHGETGLLAPERDVSALAGHLRTLLGDDEVWQRFSLAGAARVRERFDLRTQTATLELLYDGVVAAGVRR
jgi:glycosyltransferase involved in cell wall biosynthesis